MSKGTNRTPLVTDRNGRFSIRGLAKAKDSKALSKLHLYDEFGNILPDTCTETRPAKSRYRFPESYYDSSRVCGHCKKWLNRQGVYDV